MSVNKVILLGNVGKEPDVRYFEPGRGVANFTLATTERAHMGKDDQQIPERTEWHNIVVKGGLVHVVESFVRKGSKLYLEGKIRTRKYIDRENRERFVTEIVVDVLEILSRRDGLSELPVHQHYAEAHGDLGVSDGLGEPERFEKSSFDDVDD